MSLIKKISIFLAAIAVWFSQNAFSIAIPDYLNALGIPVYELPVASTDGQFARANAAMARIDPEGFPGYNFWVRYSDGVYESGVTDPNGLITLYGNLTTTMEYQLYPAPAGSWYDYHMCGTVPQIIFKGYWVNWVIYVDGIPVHGSDFQIQSIEQTDNGNCGAFP